MPSKKYHISLNPDLPEEAALISYLECCGQSVSGAIKSALSAYLADTAIAADNLPYTNCSDGQDSIEAIMKQLQSISDRLARIERAGIVAPKRESTDRELDLPEEFINATIRMCKSHTPIRMEDVQ